MTTKPPTEPTEREPFPSKEAITVAVVTGEHPFNVPAFHQLFRSLPGIDAYPQDLDEFVQDWGKVRSHYDVVLLFNWHLDTPPENERGWWQKGKTQRLEELGQTEQGIVVLHHAMWAFPGWPFWSEMVGVAHAERGISYDEVRQNVSFGERIHLDIADHEHPITRGLSPWDMVGETWGFRASAPTPDCQILLTTDHPKMRMKAMSWVRQFGKARLFYLQPGHDNHAWADETFRTVLLRGIQWAARRL